MSARGYEPDMVAGLSIGAYPAAVIAGALQYADAVKLVELRGHLMERAYPSGYGMTAIIGMTLRALERLIAQVNSEATPVFLANINAETQMVVAGSDAAMHRLTTLAIEYGAQRCERLDVATPSHCALLDAPTVALADAFDQITVRAPRIVYLSSNIARPLFDGPRIAADLAGNMARQVRWHDTVRLAWERGARLAVARRDVLDAEQDHGDVVAAAGLVGGRDEALRGDRQRVGAGDDLGDLRVGDHAGEAV